MKKNKKELILYFVFGVLTTLVSWGSYTVFVNVLHCSVALANALSWICSVLFAFVTNKLWVFESKSFAVPVLLKELSTFVLSRLLTGALELFGVPLLEKIGFDKPFIGIATWLGLHQKIFFTPGIYAKICFGVFIVILNYVFSKLLVFKSKKQPEASAQAPEQQATEKPAETDSES